MFIVLLVFELHQFYGTWVGASRLICPIWPTAVMHILNPPMAKRERGGGGGGGGAGCHPLRQVFPIFLGNEKSIFANKIFSCRLVIVTSVHDKIFQIRPAILALKLDQGRAGGGNHPPPPPH